MNEKIIRLSILSGSIVFSSWMEAFAKKVVPPPDRPNVIIIIADDAGWNDSGAYGNPGIKTPNIDRLAHEGMKFNNAFLTISSCSPSRCSIMTGLYPHNTGAGELHLPLPSDKIMFPGELKKSGYYTLSSGKWHMGPDRADFDSIFHPHEASGSADWIRSLKNRPKNKPFFMWFASNDPHRPYEDNIIPDPNRPQDVIVPPFINDNDSTRKDFVHYYDEITRLDSNIGKVMQELKEQGIDNNTVVIFMSDNGCPFPRCKTRLYDSGIKTPFIVWWPQHVKPGSSSESLVSSVDIAPTICELGNVPVPESFQGKSMVKLFSQPDAIIRDYIYAEHNWHDYQAHERVVRNKSFLYIKNWLPGLNATPPADAVRGITYQEMIRRYRKNELPESQTDCFVTPRASEELFDLQKDPYQMHNLAGNKLYAGEMTKMRSVLSSWIKATGDTTFEHPVNDMFDRWTGTPLPDVKLRKAENY